MEADFNEDKAIDIKPNIKLSKTENSKGDVYYSFDVRINGIEDADIEKLKHITDMLNSNYPRESAA